ncbi:MAG: orotidine 5'-phosphate decarboxylase / HUMPS family protein [Desulfurococcaceae archaeon TW002]
MAILQIALDLTDLMKVLELSVEIASATRCENIWLEAGTPLIKSWGKLAVKSLKDLTSCFVVADTKTMDVPRIEGTIMYEAGADAYTVLAAAEDETIKEAVETARSYGKLVIGDLISHPKPLQRAYELYRLGIEAIVYHVGISVQRIRGLRVMDLLNEAAKIKQETSLKVAVAGGIKPEDVRKIMEKGIDIVVMGGAVTSAKNPVEVVMKTLTYLASNSPEERDL